MHSYRVAQKWAAFSTNLSSIDKSGHQTNLKGTQFAVCACTSAPTKRKKSEVTLGYNDAKADQRVSESYSQIN